MVENKSSKNWLIFLNSNKDLPFSSDGVMFRILVLSDGSLRIAIEIEDETTNENLRKAIPRALDWRDRLQKWQGKYPPFPGDDIFDFLEEKKVKNSYAKIAEMIDGFLEESLREYLTYANAVKMASKYFKTISDEENWFSTEWLGKTDNELHFQRLDMALIIFKLKDILRSLKFSDELAEAILVEGLKNIRDKRSFFKKDYPISRSHIIYALRSWRKKKEDRKKIQLDFDESDVGHFKSPPISYGRGYEREIQLKGNRPWKEDMIWNPFSR